MIFHWACTPCRKHSEKRRLRGTASSAAHSFRTLADIPSGLVALPVLSFFKQRQTWATRNRTRSRVGTSHWVGAGRSAGVKSSFPRLHLFVKNLPKQLVFCRFVENSWPELSISGGRTSTTSYTAFSIDHHSFSLSPLEESFGRARYSHASRDWSCVVDEQLTEWRYSSFSAPHWCCDAISAMLWLWLWGGITLRCPPRRIRWLTSQDLFRHRAVMRSRSNSLRDSACRQSLPRCSSSLPILLSSLREYLSWCWGCQTHPPRLRWNTIMGPRDSFSNSSHCRFAERLFSWCPGI